MSPEDGTEAGSEPPPTSRLRLVAASGLVVLLFLGVQLGALALVDPLIDADRQIVEDPDSPGVGAMFFVAILVATAVMLAAFRYDRVFAIRGLIVGVSGLLGWIVFLEILPPAVAVLTANDLALAGALVLMGALLVHPEWYVIDGAGVVMGAGAAGLFGISLGLLPALLFLLVLAVYDAVSVYRTKHMLSLAEGVMDLQVPVVFVAPTTLSFSYRDIDESPTESTATDRGALFVGLGDAVIPTILVASAAVFLEAPRLEVASLALTLPALGAMVGTLVGLVVLLAMVTRGRPHAGLPLLNGGAILGYLLAALASGISLSTAVGL